MKQGKYDIPEEVNKVLEGLENAGFEAYLVGGCVRDLLINKIPKDWDVTTNATPEEIQSLFENSFYENDYGTVGIKTADPSEPRPGRESEDPALKVIEATPYRLESTYSDHRHPDEVLFSKNIKDDLARRDFTMNAIALSKGQIVDLYKGQEDIEKEVVKAVGDPLERFEEDALRILRAIRLATELSFTIDSDTSTAIEMNGELLGQISKERIRDEFVKLIMSDNPMIGVVMLQKMNLLKHIAPAIERMVDVSQETEAHKYDVFEHSLRALQHAADKGYSLELRLAALFHDIAKPTTKQMTPSGKATFHGHEVIGARVTRETLNSLRFSRETVEKVTKLVRWHMFFSDPDEVTLSAVRRIITKVGQDNIWDLMNLRKCDRIGTGRPKEQSYRFRKYQSMIEEALRDPLSVGMLKIDGQKLMDIKVEKGPSMGLILHALLEEVLDDPSLNTEEYLEKRSLELNELPKEELKELGKKGRERAEEEDKKEIEKLREKHHVK
ncbi:HD domain-containing protein [Candidatus Pacebacteria bacterium]|nr:HD domain-containing protein [Candidatus Paceibacterota bacterium]